MIEVLRRVPLYPRGHMEFVVSYSGSGEDQYYCYVDSEPTKDSRSTQNWPLLDQYLPRHFWTNILEIAKIQHLAKLGD